MVAKKIKLMKDTKSPGVEGIPPKLPMETVEQVETVEQPFARVFNLSLQEGVVPFEWKKQTSFHYLKRVREKRELQTSEFNINDL